MAVEIRWSKRAEKKFDKIIEYLLSEWDERTTEAFIRRVYDFIDILSEFPDIGVIQNREKGIRGFTIVKQINIFYHVSSDHILILDFFDNRQTPEKKKY